MPGILDFLGGAVKQVPRMVQKVASNPIVQGVGLTAAAGFNPLLGLLMAPQIQNDLDKEGADRELIGLELKALREQFDQSAKLRSSLDDLVSGLASFNVPGTGGSQSGGAASRISRDGEVFLRSLIEGGETGSAAELIGGLLGMGPKKPARGLEGTFEAVKGQLGRDLSEDEVFQIVYGGDSDLQAQLGLSQAQVELMRSQLDLESRRDEMSDASNEREETSLRKRQDFMAQVTRDLEAAELLDELDDSLLAKPGFGAGPRGKLQSALGLVDDESGHLSSLRQRFDQLSTLAGLDVVRAYGLNPTDQKFKRMMETSLSADNDPDVNRLVLLDRLNAAMEKGDDLPPAVKSSIGARIKAMSNFRRNKAFKSENEIGSALKAGEIKRGDTVILNGKKFRIE